MQKIKKYRYPKRNVGGDKAFCKLFYVTGHDVTATVENPVFISENMAYNVGAFAAGTAAEPFSINAVMGNAPGLRNMAQNFLYYKIRGIKMDLTFWQYTPEATVLYTNAVSSQNGTSVTITGPAPPFPPPNISILPEQRWAKYRVCQSTSAGGKPTRLSAYYSVNKVYGPDRITKGSADFIGELITELPYFSDTTGGKARPLEAPWMQWGIFPLNGTSFTAAEGQALGAMKTQATVYVEFFGKRTTTQ